MASSAFLPQSSDLNLRNRRKNFEEPGSGGRGTIDNEVDGNSRRGEKSAPAGNWSSKKRLRVGKIVTVVAVIALTLLSFYLRLYRIGANNAVVWDEAHFGKFGMYYIKHEFYHDVHPPLGKMLIGLSEKLAGFDGNFEFSSGELYPKNVNYTFMRQFNAIFGALCTPLAYFTARNMELSILGSFFIGFMVATELSYIALSKFILLDSILLFFTATTFYCLTQIHRLRREQLTKKWFLWLFSLGVSIGCVCSVKWVGLFVTLVAGIYTVTDLFAHRCDTSMPRTRYYTHWLVRIVNLIIVPFSIYLLCFKIHFAILYKSGTGDASANTLAQVNFEGNKINIGPRNVAFGSEVSIRSHGLSPNLLHSHVQMYPVGSGQRQITGYGHADDNNVWIFKHARTSGETDNEKLGELSFITDNSEIRLFHKNTRANLHSHDIPSHVSKGNYEVSGYGDEVVGDEKDDWIVEIVEQLTSANASFPLENSNILHPISSSFRLRHKELGCYLATTGLSYPTWGFKQAEIVCKNSWSKRDKSTWWNVEDHWNPEMRESEGYVPPKSKFWTDFVLTNFAMALSNNALVPDPDKFDVLESKAWEWPTLHVGLRMCGWSEHTVRYFLLGSPFNTWLSSLAIVTFMIVASCFLIQWQRQTRYFTGDQLSCFAVQHILPFIAWLLHFLPFVGMGRVTYVHHYVPALFFAIIEFGSLVDYFLRDKQKRYQVPAYLLLFSLSTYVFVIMSPVALGMTGRGTNYKHLEWLKSWKIV